MSNFPLYDNLKKDLSDEEITTKQKDKFMKLIKDIDMNGQELLYALIRFYQIENSDDKSTFKLPYNGKFVKNDMQFDFNDFPNKLKHILLKFIQIHIKSMKEETIIKENRDTIET